MSIKYSLVPNQLTDDPDDYRAVVQDQVTCTLDDIIEEMLARNPVGCGPGREAVGALLLILSRGVFLHNLELTLRYDERYTLTDHLCPTTAVFYGFLPQPTAYRDYRWMRTWWYRKSSLFPACRHE